MSFASALNTRQLPEKPWRLGAVARLLASVFVCMLMGTTVAMIIRYFEAPQKFSVPLFIGVAAAVLGLLVVALIMLGRPWPLEENYLLKLVILLVCIYGGIFFPWLARRIITGKLDLQNPVLTMLLTLFFFQGAAVVLVHFFLREHHMNWREGFGLKNRPGHSLLIGFCVGILALIPAWKLQDLSIQLFQRLSLQPHEQQAVEILRHTEGMLERIVLGIGTIFIAPIGEELVFRGILYPAVKRHYGQQLALWGTAIVFGVIHFNLGSFLPLTLLAVVLVWLYEYTGNLVAPIAVHCVFNAANFVMLYSQKN
jgi:membrane protease YdiL (CAAX protease family)